jgi:hypothetical protein
MNKINKVRKGEVRIYKGMTYVAVPEIKEDHCTGCCFYNEGSCLIRDPDHVDFPDCHNAYICIHKIITYSHPSGMDRWEYKNSQSNCLKQLTGYFFCHTISVIFPCQNTN